MGNNVVFASPTARFASRERTGAAINRTPDAARRTIESTVSHDVDAAPFRA
jgi:hypothetical protein